MAKIAPKINYQEVKNKNREQRLDGERVRPHTDNYSLLERQLVQKEVPWDDSLFR